MLANGVAMGGRAVTLVPLEPEDRPALPELDLCARKRDVGCYIPMPVELLRKGAKHPPQST